MESLIARELGKAMSETERELAGQMEGMSFRRRIPEKGWGGNRVIEEINKMMKLGEIVGALLTVTVCYGHCGVAQIFLNHTGLRNQLSKT